MGGTRTPLGVPWAPLRPFLGGPQQILKETTCLSGVVFLNIPQRIQQGTSDFLEIPPRGPWRKKLMKPLVVLRIAPEGSLSANPWNF